LDALLRLWFGALESRPPVAGRYQSRMFVLGTDHLSLLQWNVGPEGRRLGKRLSLVAADETATTIISFEEQMRGWLSYLGKSRTVAYQVESLRRYLDPDLIDRIA
jgi:hypothetical protein